MAAPSFARQTPNFGYPARRVHALLAAIFVIGALLRLVDVLRPVDQPSWREADLSSIARNYYRDGMNILYPRVDWGGSGPGYAEMEFPILPWLMALSYNVLGIQETTGRIISAVSSLLTIWLFIKLGKHLLRDESLLPATAFFAVSPLVVLVSTAIQSESLMLLFYVAAAYSFLRWIDSESSLDLALAAAATAAAILVKGTAAHIGLFFAILAFRHFGVRALWNAKLLLFGFVALLPPVLWYLHARGLWLIYGNSLGVSNETHWAGMALLQHSYIWKGIATIEIREVWTPAGLLVGAFALSFVRNRAFHVSTAWLFSILVYYLLAGRTTGDLWAHYYHVVAAPPAALMFGLGVSALAIRLRALPVWLAGSIALCAAALTMLAAPIAPSSRFPASAIPAAAIVVVAAALVLFVLPRRDRQARPALKLWLGGAVAVLCISSTFAFHLRGVVRDWSYLVPAGIYQCAREFAAHIPEKSLVLASGGPCVDETGLPVAYNSSYVFYWMNRKGFNICLERQSVPAVREFASQGAAYFLAERGALSFKPGFEAEMRNTFPLAAEHKDALLFRLEKP